MFGLSPDGSLRNPVILAEGSDAHASCPVSSVLRAVLAGGFSKFALAHNLNENFSFKLYLRLILKFLYTSRSRIAIPAPFDASRAIS